MPTDPTLTASTGCPPSVILFDIGGVLIDLGGMSVFTEWTGLPAQEIAARWLVSEPVREFESGRLGFGEFHGWFVGEWQVAISEAELARFFRSWVTRETPGASQLLTELKHRYPLGCLTNTNAIQWPIVCETLGIDRVFVHQFVSHLSGRLKPDAETFDEVIAALAVPAREILFFDDSQTNVAAARAAGMQSYRVAGAGEARQVLVDGGLV